ncbi:SusC/RagA family protein, partial [Bacteroides xylanisolvens]
PKVIMDRYVEDGSYLRCSDITLGYNLPKNLVSKIGFNSIGIYASVKNAFIITNYSGYNPEVSNYNSNGSLTPGVDYGSYPLSKTYSFGLNVSF